MSGGGIRVTDERQQIIEDALVEALVRLQRRQERERRTGGVADTPGATPQGLEQDREQVAA